MRVAQGENHKNKEKAVATREDYLKMIRAFPGGWAAMAAACALSKDALENRIYERKGQTVTVELAELMQSLSSTTFFAEGVARDAGGVFMLLPEAQDVGNDELLSEWNKVYARIGELSAKFSAAISDNDISKTEKADLREVSQQIHAEIEKLMALAFSVYCRPEQE